MKKGRQNYFKLFCNEKAGHSLTKFQLFFHNDAC